MLTISAANIHFSWRALRRLWLMAATLLILACIITANHTWANTPFAESPDKVFGNLKNAQTPTFLPVEQAYQLSPLIRNNQLILNWTIADGYYLYRSKITAEVNVDGNIIPLTLQLPKGISKHDEFFGEMEVYYQQVDAIATELPNTGEMQLTVTSQGCADAGLCYPPYKQFFTIDPNTSTITQNPTPAINQPIPQNTSDFSSSQFTTWILVLSSAFIGGLILNLMPCVFPVLSLKVLSFLRDEEHNHAIHGLSYTFGVVISFIGIALLLLTLRETGSALGWGYQLQSPWFVALLIYLFFTLALNLSGFFEFKGIGINSGNTLTQQSGYSGSFATGLLATLVASPCTAPFMGAALGFAITQPTAYALWIFIFLGLGMATPVLVLSLSPALLKYLPKPGTWMLTFKKLLAFPLYATALWLAWVLSHQTGTNGLFSILAGCLAIGFAIALWPHSIIGKMCAALAIAIAAYLPFSSLLSESTSTNSVLQIDDNAQIQPWSAEYLQVLRQQGRPVFVNVTADWCITCLANENLVLNTDAIKNLFKEEGIVYLKADWTRYDANITRYLEEFGRNGVPLYVFYPTNNGKPVVLPQLLQSGSVTKIVKSDNLKEDSSK